MTKEIKQRSSGPIRDPQVEQSVNSIADFLQLAIFFHPRKFRK
jgi:hypothetical protein